MGGRRSQDRARASSYASSSSAPSLSRSAPVSPSASFASLAALRHSLAMRSGDLGLEESAHTFPVDDDTPNAHHPSNNAGLTSIPTGGPSTPLDRGQSASVSSSAHGDRAPSSRPPPGPGPVPPPLSMHNLPPPRTALSAHHDRRMSPFHESRGMSFTPAATPPLTLSPTAPTGDCETHGNSTSRPTTTTAGSPNGSSLPYHSPSSSPNSSFLNAGRIDSSRRSLHSRRPRSRTASDASINLTPMSRRSSRHSHLTSEHSSSTAPSAPNVIAMPALRHHRLTPSGPGSAAGFPESDASDTGAEGDADDVPRQPLRARPARTRSNSQVSSGNPSEGFLGVRNRAGESQAMTNARRSGYATVGGGSSRRQSLHSRSPSSELMDGSTNPREDSSYPELATAEMLWQLHQAALGLSATAGMGVGIIVDHSHSSPSPLAEAMMPPPPPYQANDDIDHIQLTRQLVNELEREQAEASQGRRLEGSEVEIMGDWETPVTDMERANGLQGDQSLFFRSPLHRRREDRRPSNDAAAVGRQGSLVTQTLSAPQVEHIQGQSPAENGCRNVTMVGMAEAQPQSQSPHLEISPPAWQPKSDTEGDTDTNETYREGFNELGGDAGLTSPERPVGTLISQGQGVLADCRRRSSRRSINGHLASSPLARQLAEEEDYSGPSPFVLRYLLHPLRLLAAVPGCVGTFWLVRNATIHLQSSQSLFVRGPLDADQAHLTNPWRMTRALDFLLASLWALSTAYHALSLTTLLLRRWLIYYSLTPSLIRLLALQAICWPLVRMTVFIAGPDRPIEAWIVIASTTAFSDVVARWVTSNIADAPTKRKMQKREQTAPSSGGKRSRSRSRTRLNGDTGVGAPNLQLVSDTATPTIASSRSGRRERDRERSSQHQRQRRRRGHVTPSAGPGGRVRTGQRFWRAIMGAPIDSSTSDSGESTRGEEDEDGESEARSLHASALDTAGNSRLSIYRQEDSQRSSSCAVYPKLTETDLELEGETTDAGATTTALLDEDEDEENGETAEETLHRLRVALRRRRRHRMRIKMAALQGGLPSSSSSSSSSTYHQVADATVPNLWSTQSTETVASTRARTTDGSRGFKVRSRRVFHWEVAIKRNVAPIGILAYLTLWGMLIGTQ